MRNFIKYFCILTLTLLISVSLYAQKSDSILVTESIIKYIVQKDSALCEKNVQIDTDSLRVFFSKFSQFGDYIISTWEEKAKCILSTDSILFNADFDLLNKKIVINQFREFIFFTPNRYIEIQYRQPEDNTKPKQKWITEYGLWKKHNIDSLNVISFYQGYFRNSSNNEIILTGYQYIIPLKNGKFYMSSTGESYKIQTNDYRHTDVLISRENMGDTDIVEVNGKYGLYTLFGQEVIPAIYDSIQINRDGHLVIAYNKGNVSLLDYYNNVVKDSLKAAVYCGKYQVIDKNNRMYYLGMNGSEIENFYFGGISVDDILYPITPGSRILPKKKGVRESACWVKFEYNWNLDGEWWGEDRKELEKQKRKMTVEQLAYDIFEYNLFEIISKEVYEEYDVEVCPIPKRYKDMRLANNEQEFPYSGDYEELPVSWIIARKGRKFGMFDVHNTNKSILPFKYNSIIGERQGRLHILRLELNGLQCYYPISSTPCYVKLEKFNLNFARFQLPNGQKGWLGLNGKEYFD